MAKKISVSEFISKKQLEKIQKMIEKSANTDDAYDKIENLLLDNFTVKDLGTNRLILTHNKNKKFICKIAGDSHGIDANYREFYNGDLDEKRITKSYSISENGVFLVQERVTPFTSEMMSKHKKDVRKMLHRLEDKLLLVDCKLSNFKNFGIRKNGDIVLLDHGDTVPLTMYENGKIVNLLEETNVSLRCREYKKGTLTGKNPKPCGGKLEYSKNFDYFICKKCGCKSAIHSAYKEFYGYARLNNDDEGLLEFQEGFDPKEYAKKVQESIKQYAKDTMNKVEKKKDKEKENGEMFKQINGQKCQQIKGYWLPIKSDVPLSTAKLLAVKRGDCKPDEFLRFIGLNPDDYKMTSSDHINSRRENEERNSIMSEISNYILSELVTIDDPEDLIHFENQKDSRRNGAFRPMPLNKLAAEFSGRYDTTKNIFYIHAALKNAKYVEDGNEFIVRHAFFDRDTIYIKFTNDDNWYNDYQLTKNAIDDEDYVEDDMSNISDSFDDEEEEKDDGIDILDYFDDDDEPNNTNQSNASYSVPETSNSRESRTFTFNQISSMETTLQWGEDCIEIDGYYIPITIINRYYNPNKKLFVFPPSDVMLNDNNRDPELYKVTDELVSEDSVTPNIITPINSYEKLIEDDENLDKFTAELIDILDTNGYDNHGTAKISYKRTVELLQKYGYDNYIEGGKLNAIGIEFLADFEEFDSIADYVYSSEYAISVLGREKEKTYTERVQDLVNNYPKLYQTRKLLVALFSLIDYDQIDIDFSNDDMAEYIGDMTLILSRFEANKLNVPLDHISITDIYDNESFDICDLEELIKSDASENNMKAVVNCFIYLIVVNYAKYIVDRPDILEMLSEFIDDESYINYLDIEADNNADTHLKFIDEFNKYFGKIKEDAAKKVVDTSFETSNSLNEILRMAMSSLSSIHLSIEDLRDKNFMIKVDSGENGSEPTIVKIDLYNILKNKLSR